MSLMKWIIFNRKKISLLLVMILFKFSIVVNADVINNISNSEIVGDLQVQIPVCGESIAEYEVKSNISGWILKLEKDYKGITLKDNILTLNTSVDEKEIKIIAYNGNNILEKDIELTKSWTLDEKAIDGTPLKIPEEIKPIRVILSDKIIHLIQIIISILVVMVLTIYIVSRKKFLKDKKVKGEVE